MSDSRQRRGLEPLPEQSTMTLAELATWWLKNHCPKPSVARAGATLRRHVIETTAGTLPLPVATTGKLEVLFRSLSREAGLGPSTINHVRAYLRTAFNRTRKAGMWMGDNPAADTEPRKVPRRAYQTLSAEEVPIMLAHVSPDWRGFMAAGAYLGLRKGEAAGLRKTDVDLASGLVTIRASYDNDTTKGKHADVLPIPPPLVAYVTAGLRTPGQYLFPAADGSMRGPDSDPEKALRFALGRAGIVEGYDHVCRGCKHQRRPAHTWRHPDKATRDCETCGMRLWVHAVPRPLRFHDLRHSAATVLLRAGVDAHRVQRILRHASVTTTTGTYGHLLAEDLRAAMSTAWGGAPAEPEARPEVEPEAVAIEAVAIEACSGAVSSPNVTLASPESETRAEDPTGCARNVLAFQRESLARPTGFEPVAPGLEAPPNGAAPSRTQRQLAATKGKAPISQQHRGAPKHPPFQVSCYPVVTRNRGHARVAAGGTDHLLTVREVASLLRVCTATVYSLCERGELAHVRLSNAIR
ncbi:MAG: hypothetical protein A2289_19150, partial [Deltaproteobacteria bacterium RIFOXYA12_FULL_58_15]